MKLYYLAVRSGLLFTRAALKQQTLPRVVTLLLDSGSSYTILSWGTIASLGLDPGASAIRRPVMTANGELLLPEVTIEEFHALGQRLGQFLVLAHTIPLGRQVHGILGMNFLRQFETCLNFKQATIQLC
jgi:predicted aspartyl protease